MVVVETVAGNGTAGFAGDGASAASSQIAEPFGVVVGPDAAIYFCDLGNHRIRRIDTGSGLIRTIVGNGRAGNAGDGGAAVDAEITEPYELRFDAAGDLYFVDMKSHVVRKVTMTTGVIETVAGTGEAGFGGDGGLALEANFNQPHSIELDGKGGLFVADIRNHRIRRMDLATGVIDTFAGTGEQAETPDGAPLTGTPLNGPRAIAFDRAGNMVLALREGNAILSVDLRKQEFQRLAGNGETGLSGDGGAAREAALGGPKGIALAPDSSIFIADTENHAIRRIDAHTNIITTVIGDGSQHDGPDGAPLKCGLARPHGVFVDAGNNVYVGDSDNHRLRVLRNSSAK